MAHTHVSVDYVFPRGRRPGLSHELGAGGRAGVIAGLAMAVALMGLSATFLGRGPFYPLEVVAASVTGSGAPGPATGKTLLLGAFVHLAGPALCWGFVFGFVVWVFRPERSVALLWLGLLIGATAQVVDVNLLIPALSRSATLPDIVPLHVSTLWLERVPKTVSWLAHLVFGIGLSIYPWRFDPEARTFD